MKKVCELVKGGYEATMSAARTRHLSVKVTPRAVNTQREWEQKDTETKKQNDQHVLTKRKDKRRKY